MSCREHMKCEGEWLAGLIQMVGMGCIQGTGGGLREEGIEHAVVITSGNVVVVAKLSD